MQRRKFIQNLAKQLGLLSLSPSLLAACKKDESLIGQGKKVLIIGAGIAGLAAGKKLKSRGFEVEILEAQNEIAGRLRTNRSLGLAFDQGASWIHGSRNNPITDLARQAGMNTSPTDDDSLLAYDMDGSLINDNLFTQEERNFRNILNSLHRSGSLGRSFEEVFNSSYPNYINNRLWKFFLSAYLCFDTGDIDKLSSLYYDEGEVFGGEELLAINGYDKIPHYLANGLNIKLNQRVNKIDYEGTKVKVYHNNQVTEGNYALVTVPLGVLKANRIEFKPALPQSMQTAISKVGMNCVNKFLLVWDRTFWGQEQYLAYTPNIRDKFNYFLNLNKNIPNANALMSFAYADAGRQTEALSDGEVIAEIMLHLKAIYGNNIPNPRAMLRTRWQADENSFGSYSYPTRDTEMKHFDDLAKAIGNKVFFGGEHTSRDYFSTVHGAYLSGLREADKIIALR